MQNQAQQNYNFQQQPQQTQQALQKPLSQPIPQQMQQQQQMQQPIQPLALQQPIRSLQPIQQIQQQSILRQPFQAFQPQQPQLQSQVQPFDVNKTNSSAMSSMTQGFSSLNVQSNANANRTASNNMYANANTGSSRFGTYSNDARSGYNKSFGNRNYNNNQGYGGNSYHNSGGYNNRAYGSDRYSGGGYRGRGQSGNSGGYGRGGGRRSGGYGNYGGGGGRGYNNNGGGRNRGQSSQQSYSYSDNANFRAASTERDPDLEQELFHSTTEVSEGINFAEYDKIPVEASGTNVPDPLTNFQDSGLAKILLENIVLSKYSKPTPIQKYSIPLVLNDRDVMACAQTGSGKTAAFLLPIIHQLLKQPKDQNLTSKNGYYRSTSTPLAAILSPTRELAIQIHMQARKFLYRTGMRSAVVYGGADWRNQSKSLRYGVEIVVATPGRLNDFMQRELLRMNRICYCVLDEADRMLDMGFMPQIKQIIGQMPEKSARRMLMFSATFPLEIQRLAQEFLQDYVFVAIGRVGSTNDFITQKLRKVENWEKTEQLVELLSEVKGLALIFVEKKRDAWRVERELIQNGHDAMSIHGDRSQSEREHALKLFRTAEVRFLVATDVAARGLDIPNVMWVINYDLPNNIDSYVHRIGRTGRCGNGGTAISFVNESNRPVLKALLQLLQESKSEIPQWFSQLCYKAGGRSSNSYYGSRGRGRGRGGRNYSSGYGRRNYNTGQSGSRFGGRDFRSRGRSSNENEMHRSYDNQKSGNWYNKANGGSGENNQNLSANSTNATGIYINNDAW